MAARLSRASAGVTFVHAADEFYLLAGVDPPAGDAPEQYENGIGIAAALLAEAAATWRCASLRGIVRRAAAVGDARAARRRPRGGDARGGVRRSACGPSSSATRLFGPHVTVTGLLGGVEMLAALRRTRSPAASGCWRRASGRPMLGRTLDDVAEDELAAACGGRLVLADSLGRRVC